MGAVCIVAQAEGMPKIQFDQTVYDFGKTSQVETVSSVFKFKNARLDEVPASTVSGNVSFETSVTAQTRIEVSVIVNVFKP